MQNILFQKDNGMSLTGAYFIGPYVGFERHFAGSNVLLTFFILPVDYNVTSNNDGTGGKITTTGYQFFRQGGLGITYLF